MPIFRDICIYYIYIAYILYIYYTFYTGQILWYLTKGCYKICRAMRSHSVSCDVQSKVQVWIEFRA